MKLFKKTVAVAAVAAMALSVVACGGNGGAAASSSAAASTTASSAAGKKFTVGICQLVQHEALDAATKGFREALEAELGKDNVTFDEQNAQGDANTCSTIINGLVNKKVDLIMANATPALQAAQAGTNTIPVLGTSITEYGVALDIKDFKGLVGTNISGTSDLAPLKDQAAMIKEVCPDTKNVAIIYCSAEANSKYQADTIAEDLKALGIESTITTFSDSNDLAGVVDKVLGTNPDAIYVPTDNTVASNTEILNSKALAKKVPVFAGEEGICKGCGIATLSISYYDLGVATGKMAAKILKGESKVAEMPIEYAAKVTKKYNKDVADKLGIKVPEGYEEIK